MEKLHIHRLENSTGSFVEICNFGATLISLFVPDRYGKLGNVLLRYDQMQDYFANPVYLGSTIGRYANRIENSSYQYRGRVYKLQGNEGRQHLHGGALGFSHRFWVFADECSSSVAHLSLFSEDGDQGYPGNLIVNQTIRFSDDNVLTIEYRALGDAATPVNLCNHAYFNLSAGLSTTIEGHVLRMDALEYLPVSSNLIPNGELRSVKGECFDFTGGCRLGDVKNLGLSLNASNGDFDHTFVLNNMRTKGAPVAWLYEPLSGRCLTLATSKPGLHLYTGFHLDQNLSGVQSFVKRAGLCLETQYFPNSPNIKHFPRSSIVIGEQYYHTTEFRFSVA